MKRQTLCSVAQASGCLQGFVMVSEAQVSYTTWLPTKVVGSLKVNDAFLLSYPESLSLDSSFFSPPPVNFLQELPSYRSIARKRTNIPSRDKQSGTLLKPTDSYTSQLEEEIAENLNSQSIRKYALNISEKRRLRFVQ